MTRRRWWIGLSGVLLLPLLVLAAMSWMEPKPGKLGATDGRLRPCPESPNCVSSQAADPRHRMEPLRFSGSSADAWLRLRQGVAVMPRTVVVSEEPGRYLHVEFTTRVFRYTDDVEFLLDEAEGVIHFRSASRIGHYDLGTNRRRMSAVRRAFQRAA